MHWKVTKRCIEKSPEEKYYLVHDKHKVHVKLYKNNSLLKKLHA